MKVLVVNAYGRSNRGDSVLLDECVAEIRAWNPKAAISAAVFEGADNARRVHPDIAWSERIGNAPGGKVHTLCLLLASWLATVPGLRRLEKLLPPDQQKTLNAMRECNVVVSSPGGYIHDTNFAYIIALFHIELATRLRKAVVLGPQSIGPLHGRFARWLASRVLARVSYLCPRESYSANFLVRDLGIPERQVYRTGDSAFWNDRVEGDSAAVTSELLRLGLDEGKPILGITVVGWTFPRHAQPSAAYDSYVAAVAEIADRMALKNGVLPVIFNQVSDDLPTALLVKKRAKSQIVVDEKSHEPWILRALIRRSTIFLGTRFHSCIFSMMAGRPTFAISYLPKTEYIMSDLHLTNRSTPIDDVDVDRVVEKLSADLNDIAQAELEISSAVDAYQRDFSRLQDIMRSINIECEA
ncbi:polysaccharide pyruvyl transferase family protein (plasmid) [Cupriavidus pinatubonensis]|uniref:polysaccharide pyruvyl transferase family protein n=1 Tax=Cupriavidus pinatubonensis TaxID=248026 RepID=UPI001C73BD8D|nr:polysaccharide pyruvyl transferase family protein [Cupriavidus pinatubonensis]QYY34186.1 polysaccharide pyruvyl transferase family protein [Cupriavidus pinatubonensis]